jgi:hypothetical protein
MITPKTLVTGVTGMTSGYTVRLLLMAKETLGSHVGLRRLPGGGRSPCKPVCGGGAESPRHNVFTCICERTEKLWPQDMARFTCKT